MKTRERRSKRRVVGKRGGERKRLRERTKFVRASSSEDRVVEWNSDTMSITRSVDISVIAIMRDELMIISKRDANKEIERSIHDEKIK